MTVSAEAYFTHEHDDDPVRLSTPGDVDRLVDELLAGSWENSVAALYVDGRLNAAGVPDHELLVAVDYKNKSVGALRYMGDEGVHFTKGNTDGDDAVPYYYMGSDREFPRNSLLPLDQIRTAVKEFLAGGGDRPMGVEWRDWQDNA